MFYLGIDLGGTKIEGIILDEKHQTLFRERIPTEREKGYEHILNNIKRFYQKMTAEIKQEKHVLGVGTPGTYFPQSGVLGNSNTTCLNQKPFYFDLKQMIGRDFAIQNDANCFALAEALMGAGKGKQSIFGVILGTGCGGGLVLNGKVWSGLQGIAGEWGHTVFNPQGAKCYCGKYGCVETAISGSGLERRYEEEFKELKELPEIVKDYKDGENNANRLMNQFFRDFGVALSNVINVLDPEIVVLGGGVSNIDDIYTDGVKQVHKNIFCPEPETPIVKNQLGDSAGVIGAALLGI